MNYIFSQLHNMIASKVSEPPCKVEFDFGSISLTEDRLILDDYGNIWEMNSNGEVDRYTPDGSSIHVTATDMQNRVMHVLLDNHFIKGC